MIQRRPLRLPAALLFAAAILASMPALACSGRLHLETGPTGVYHLKYADAVAAVPGLAGCELADLRMRNRGEEVAIRVLDNGDGVFSAGDSIEWVGHKLHGPETWSDQFSMVNVYELDSAPGKHQRYRLREAPADAARAAQLGHHLHLENDHMMIRLTGDQVAPGEEPDLWYWAKMTMVDPKPLTVQFDLPDLQDNFPEPQLTLTFRGLSSINSARDDHGTPDHNVQVTLNGQRIADLKWDGADHIERHLQLPAGLLRENGNTLVLDVPSRRPDWAKHRLVDVVMFDYLDIHYPLATPGTESRMALSVAAAGSPVLSGTHAPLLFGSDGALYPPTERAGKAHYAPVATGTRLFPLGQHQQPMAPAGMRAAALEQDWRHPQQGYDYIMITHPSLMQAIQPLAEFHREHGLDTVVINVNAAYDQFNHGIVDPQAIHDLLEYAYDNWPGQPPHYVLLVGDASFDPHNRLRKQKFYATWAARQLLQPGGFSRIPGPKYENAPEAANARNLIPTFFYYAPEGQAADDNAFVAFDEDSHKPMMAIGRFPVVTPEEVAAIVDKTIDYVENPKMGSWRQSVMFITNDSTAFQKTSNKLAADLGARGFSPVKVYPSESDKNNIAHQKAIMNDIEQGQLLVHFMGHGGRYIWRTGPPDPTKNHDLFTMNMVEQLKNAGQLPMVLAMTCYSAPFSNPTHDSIGEKFLRVKNSGAIAVFAASWRNAPDISFSKYLMENLLTPGMTIGNAIMQTKRQHGSPIMTRMYNLLGDPAVALQRPQERLQITQIRDPWNPGVAIQIPGATRFNGKLRVTWLDQDENVLSEQVYAVHSPKLRLPEAPEGASEVRVYALDPSRSADALGALKLTPPPEPERSWWMPDPEPTPLPLAQDRIFGTNFASQELGP